MNANNEEKEFLSQYDISKYERPSVAADIVIFSILEDGECENFRKLKKSALKVLLVKRAAYPYKNKWALPGGFLKSDETVYETAKRELLEETNIKDAYIKMADVYSDLGRDPRGWVISNTFLALVDGSKCALKAKTDASEARWFNVEINILQESKELNADGGRIESLYELILSNNESREILTSKIREMKVNENYHESVQYTIEDNNDIAFDHCKIILSTLLGLRKSAGNEERFVFDLMPELFTLTQLQSAFEMVLGQKLITANFRRKISEYVIETDESLEGAGHRPAKLFKRNVEKFYG